jgi:uncharacterized protein (DUF885 family)
LGDNSPQAFERWRAKEDGLLAEVNALNAAALQGRPEGVTYGVLKKDRLENGRAVRSCHEELWWVRNTLRWVDTLHALSAAQPIGSAVAKERAIARTRDLPRVLDVELGHLRRGLELGFTAAKPSGRAALEQLDGVLAAEALSVNRPAA